jgi:hypothetical protein
MSNCNLLLKSLNPSCLSFKKAGGLKKEVYVGFIQDIASTTLNPTTGEIATLTLKGAAKIHKFTGMKFRNTAGASLQVSENGPRLRNHTVTMQLFHTTQNERNVMDSLLDASEAFVVVPLQSGKVKIYGYNPTAESHGLEVTQAEESDGTKLEDSTSMTLTFAGAETALPFYLQIGQDYPATIAALDALASAAV